MPVVPFIPAIAQVGGAAVGGIMSRRAQQNAMKRSPEEAAAISGATGIAGQAGRTATSLISKGQEALTAPTNYFQTLLRGNRAAMTQAVAPQIAQATDVFRGAERGYDRAGLRGAARDVATADLGRARASHIASLTTGVQPMAANALASMGQNMTQQGAGLVGTAGNIYSNLLTGASDHRKWAEQRGTEAGQSWGRLVQDIINKVPWGGTKGGGGGGTGDMPWLSQHESLPSPMQWKYGGGF